jgi:hypothetical protein
MDTEGGGQHVVCMLAEGRYFHGAAALSNSLVRNGFSGHLVVGYRGALPSWEGPVQPADGSAQTVADGVDLRFVPLDTDWNLGNRKPHFLLQVASEIHPDAASIWYFDVDIVMKVHWANFARWVSEGVVVVHDLAETFMVPDHVFRREWRALARRAGHESTRPVTGYFNSGCVGLRPTELGLITIWCDLINLHAAEGGEVTRLISRDGKPEFAKTDQDLLNAALMASDVPYGTLGIEAMDAFPSAEIMSHAMILGKPWSRDYILEALRGFQPDAPHLAFWSYATGPIRSFPAAEWARKRRAVRVARLIGHLKRRTYRDW